MTNRVLIDCNVLVSASIKTLCDDIGIAVKHEFFDICEPLFSLFEKHIDQRLGCITPKIEKTSRRVLKKSIISELEKIIDKGGAKETDVYKKLVLIHIESLRSLKDNVGKLIIEPVNFDKIQKKIGEIFSFYVDLRKDIQKSDPFVSVEKRRLWLPSYLKKGGFDKKILKVLKEDGQVYRRLERKFITEFIDFKDIDILASCCYLKEVYKIGNFYLASTDFHFSKIPINGKNNDLVPNRIEKRFGIICLWPNEIVDNIKI